MFFRKKEDKKNKEKETTEIKEIEFNTEKMKFNNKDEIYFKNFKVSFDFSSKDEFEMIKKWRIIADNTDVDDVLEDIINEAICEDKEGNIVKLDLSKLDLSKNIKNKIYEEFDYILNLLNFNINATEYFKRWFIDGRIFTQNIYDIKNIKNGIQQIKLVNPFDILPLKIGNERYFLYFKYNEKINVFNNKNELLNNSKKLQKYDLVSFDNQSLLIPDMLINYVPGAVYSNKLGIFVSPLEKAYKRINQLQLLEDHILVYRIIRASEKRVFYIDVGKMSAANARQYLKKLAQEFSKEFSYNPDTGEIDVKQAFSNMIENIWLTRRDGKSTEITTLEGAQNLGELSDLDYFERKFYIAMKVPIGRKLKTENMFVLGKTGEITREEIKFSRYIQSLRNKFSLFLLEPLRKQLITKNILSEEEYEKIKNNIKVVFFNNNLYEMLKEFDVLSEKLDLISNMDNFVGKYFTKDDIHKILGRNEDEIKEFEEKIKEFNKNNPQEDKEEDRW